MKAQRFFLMAAAALAVLLLISGCGGSKSQSVGTQWNGSVAGMDTLPPDGDTGVATDTWIKVYWPDPNYEPPRSFTFKLYKYTPDGWQIVRTLDKDSYPETGIWWFAPEHPLDYDTDYRIVVTDDYGDSHTHYFTTELGRSRAATGTKHYIPETGGKAGGTAADEHTVTTAR